MLLRKIIDNFNNLIFYLKMKMKKIRLYLNKNKIIMKEKYSKYRIDSKTNL